uniref:Alkylated DNA repair protein AlkB homologue 8 N-terminal domain-containing protein n=1 Tax=Amphiprion ocellaris TaxID=80972 RepID=A0AAQ5ZEW9_AMPOC
MCHQVHHISPVSASSRSIICWSHKSTFGHHNKAEFLQMHLEGRERRTEDGELRAEDGERRMKNGGWWSSDGGALMVAQQRLHFLRVLRKNNLDRNLLLTFYSSSIENLLTFCVSTWYRSCTEADRARLQRIVGCPLPSLMDIYSTRCLSRAQNIIKDSSHPGSQLFDLLPSGRRYRCIKARTNRLKNSFFLRAITTLNSHMSHISHPANTIM